MSVGFIFVRQSAQATKSPTLSTATDSRLGGFCVKEHMKIGWFKFHRKTLRNRVWRHYPTAWRVFETLMMIADYEKGMWSGGRIQLAELAGVSESATYRALKRLQTEQMIECEPNNKWTDIYICKWNEYQDEPNNKRTGIRTTNEHSIKNQEERTKKKTNTVNGMKVLNEMRRQLIEKRSMS